MYREGGKGWRERGKEKERTRKIERGRTKGGRSSENERWIATKKES